MIKVLVVDDHVVVAEALESTLGSVEGLEVVATGRTGAEGLALALSLRPDVALIDFRLPDISGADVVRRLRAEGASRPSLPLVPMPVSSVSRPSAPGANRPIATSGHAHQVGH